MRDTSVSVPSPPGLGTAGAWAWGFAPCGWAGGRLQARGFRGRAVPGVGEPSGVVQARECPAFDPQHLRGGSRRPHTLLTQDEALRWHNHSTRDKVMVAGCLGCLVYGQDPPPYLEISVWVGAGTGEEEDTESGLIVFPPSFSA